MSWDDCILKDVASEIQTGPFGSQLHQSDYSDHGIPVVMPKDLIGGHVSEESIARVDESHVKRLSRHMIHNGDILYSRRGDVGRCAFATEKEKGWLCGTGCLRITINPSIANPQFVFYQLQKPETVGWVEKHAVGATMLNLNTSILGSIPLLLPSLFEQNRIVSILSAYDDLIENNRRQIKLLEEAARRLYREWFVDFRFPGHEQTKIVDGIPEGWKRYSYYDVVTIMSGGTPKTERKEYYSGSIPFYTPKDTKGNFFVFDTLTTITEEGLKNCHSQLYPAGTVIITARGTVGKTVLLAVPMAMNQSCYALKCDRIESPYYLFFSLNEEVKKLKAMANGGVFGTIIIDTFKRITILISPNETEKRFEMIITPYMEKIKALIYQNSKLKFIKEELIVHLFK